MIFSVSPQMTTLYDEIEYQGSPSSFAWVLPIHGPVRVGLSSDILFAAIEQVTRTDIVAPPCGGFGRGGPSLPGAVLPPLPASGGGGGGGVTVISQQVVGPYDTVQLQSTDPSALNAWLLANGFAIPPDVQAIVAAYVSEGFDFLAMRLAPGHVVQAMRPISVRSSGAALSLPLRMVAAGTGAKVGVTLWVVSDGRYEPQNFPAFTISPTELVWDWSTNLSNYTTLRAQREAALNNAGWQIESSLETGPYQVENLVLRGTAAPNYTAIPSSDAGPGETADQVRTMDLATLFPSGGSSVRITRMRADLSRAALTNDLVLQAAPDQSPISNVYQVALSVCSPPGPCPCGSNPPADGGNSPILFGGGGTAPHPSGGGGSGGGGSSSGGGMAGSHAAQGRSLGCVMSPADSSGEGIELALASLLGAALVRTSARKKRVS